MSPRRPARLAGRSSGRSRFDRAQPVEFREDGGRLALVPSAELGEVGVRHVSGRVLELELADSAEGDAFVLGELLAAVDGQGEERSPALVSTEQRPEHEDEGRHANDD
jgi:hypothetical protein